MANPELLQDQALEMKLTTCFIGDSSSTTPAVHPCVLPLDIFGLIAKHLITNQAYGTCASLNGTSKAVYAETTKILWRSIVFWRNDALKFLPLDLPGRGKSAGDPTVDVVSAEQSSEEIGQMWDSLIRSRGAVYIE